MSGVTVVLGWATYHGNDKVWNSLAQDKVLTRFQLLRIRNIIQALYFNPSSIKDTDVRFLYFTSSQLESTDPHSFTLLVISQLLSAIKTNGHNSKAIEDPYAPRRAYRPPRKDPIRVILPDYYVNDNGYSRGDVNGMLVMAKNLDNVGFSLRAGMVTSPTAVKEISRLLEDKQSRFLIVNKKKMDKEEVSDISELVNTVGPYKVFIEMKEGSVVEHGEGDGGGHHDSTRVPEPREFSHASNLMTQQSNFCIILLAYLIFSHAN